jgi:hypothetical protein
VENAEDVRDTSGIVKNTLKNPDRQVRELGKKVLVRILGGIGASTSMKSPDASRVIVEGWHKIFLAPQLLGNSILPFPQANLLVSANQIGGFVLGSYHVFRRIRLPGMESEWVVLICRKPNCNSADARDSILLPVAVQYTRLRFRL